jgi:hypothetical protein
MARRSMTGVKILFAIEQASAVGGAGGAPQPRRIFGSSASRRPSPVRLMAMTVMRMAKPEARAHHP